MFVDKEVKNYYIEEYKKVICEYKEKKENELKIVLCPSCKSQNRLGDEYCKCGVKLRYNVGKYLHF